MHEPERDDRFRNQLTSLLNCNSMEGGSNTPDFILARYLLDCLRAFDLATDQREHWYGLKHYPGKAPQPCGPLIEPREGSKP